MITELALGTLMSAALLFGSGAVLKSQWNRTRCAYQVFEQTHRALVSGGLGVASQVRLNDSSESMRGELICGKAREVVELPKLEFARW